MLGLKCFDIYRSKVIAGLDRKAHVLQKSKKIGTNFYKNSQGKSKPPDWRIGVVEPKFHTRKNISIHVILITLKTF